MKIRLRKGRSGKGGPFEEFTVERMKSGSIKYYARPSRSKRRLEKGVRVGFQIEPELRSFGEGI